VFYGSKASYAIGSVGFVDGPWAAVEDALKECARITPWARSAQELIDGLDRVHVLASQLTFLGLALLAEIDGRGIPKAQGASSTAAWLRDRYRLSPGTASQQVKLAAALDSQLPEAAAALAAGSLNVEQAQLIAKAVPDLPAEHRADGEKFLVAQCAQLGPKELGRVTDRLLERIAPDVVEQRAAEQLARGEQRAYADRCLHLTEIHGDTRVRVSGWLDRESAAILRAAIDPLCAPRSTPDHADSRGAHPQSAGSRGADLLSAAPRSEEFRGAQSRGAESRGAGSRTSDSCGAGSSHPDPRTPGQRRADALVDVCRLALACGDLPDNGGDRPQVVVTVDIDTLREQTGAAILDDGAVLSPAAARRWACDARILPAVLGGTGQVLDLGRERRLFTGPIRRALVLRDRGCAFPGCDRPPRWCEGHHIVSWLDHGPTTLANGVLLCRHHHRVIHHSPWQVRIAADSVPEFIPPEYIDPRQQPRRNNYHRQE
jgi:hypothetical protein